MKEAIVDLLNYEEIFTVSKGEWEPKEGNKTVPYIRLEKTLLETVESYYSLRITIWPRTTTVTVLSRYGSNDHDEPWLVESEVARRKYQNTDQELYDPDTLIEWGKSKVALDSIQVIIGEMNDGKSATESSLWEYIRGRFTDCLSCIIG